MHSHPVHGQTNRKNTEYLKAGMAVVVNLSLPAAMAKPPFGALDLKKERVTIARIEGGQATPPAPITDSQLRWIGFYAIWLS